MFTPEQLKANENSHFTITDTLKRNPYLEKAQLDGSFDSLPKFVFKLNPIKVSFQKTPNRVYCIFYTGLSNQA